MQACHSDAMELCSGMTPHIDLGNAFLQAHVFSHFFFQRIPQHHSIRPVNPGFTFRPDGTRQQHIRAAAIPPIPHSPQ
jgi:hypothetical protein